MSSYFLLSLFVISFALFSIVSAPSLYLVSLSASFITYFALCKIDKEWEAKKAERHLKVGFFVIFFFWITSLLTKNYLTYAGQGGFDLPWFTQVVYNIRETGSSLTTLDTPIKHMGQHFEPILFIIAGLSHVLNVPIGNLLICLQAIGLLAVASTIFISTNESDVHLNFKARIIIAGLFIIGWGTTSANTFEFHPVTLGASLALAGFFYGLCGKRTIGIALIFLSVLCGELYLVMTPVIASTVFIYLGRRSLTKKFLLLGISFAGGCILLYSYISYFAPFWRGDQSQFAMLSRYSHLGNGPKEILQNILLNPFEVYALQAKMDGPGEILGYLALTILAYILFLSVGIYKRFKGEVASGSHSTSYFLIVSGFLVCGPSFGKILLSNYEPFFHTGFHYYADIFLGVSIIGTGILGITLRMFTERSVLILIPIGLACLLVSFPGPVELRRKLKRGRLPITNLDSALKEIPTKLSVYTNSPYVLARVAERHLVYSWFSSGVNLKTYGNPDVVIIEKKNSTNELEPLGPFGHTIKPSGDAFSTLDDAKDEYKLSRRFDTELSQFEVFTRAPL